MADRTSGSLRERQQAALKEMEANAKTRQKWPSWRYGPDGQEQIFEREEDVPDGWEDHPNKLKKTAGGRDATEFQGGHVSDDNEDYKWIMDPANGATTDIMTHVLEDADVEFVKSWPKAKLAKTVIANKLTDEVKAQAEED